MGGFGGRAPAGTEGGPSRQARKVLTENKQTWQTNSPYFAKCIDVVWGVSRTKADTEFRVIAHEAPPIRASRPRRRLADDAPRGDNAGMNDTSASAALLQTVKHETGPAPAWTVLWLHGLGADGHDFTPIVPELVRRDWPALRFVFPHAPVRPVTINNGASMRAWYDIVSLDAGRMADRADEAGVTQSVAQVEALIARELERGVAPERIVLAGFSQGGAVALAAGLRRRQPLAGLVALSTYLPLSTAALAGLEQSVATAARTQPLFMAHGQFDPVVPFAAGEASATRLRALGFAVDWHAYPMAHQVCAEQIRDLGDWLAARFASG